MCVHTREPRPAHTHAPTAASYCYVLNGSGKTCMHMHTHTFFKLYYLSFATVISGVGGGILRGCNGGKYTTTTSCLSIGHVILSVPYLKSPAWRSRWQYLLSAAPDGAEEKAGFSHSGSQCVTPVHYACIPVGLKCPVTPQMSLWADWK